MHGTHEVLVIGGGFFGCAIALHLRRCLGRVLVVEQQGDLMQRASFANQARVHHGYHYPRSRLTALRSRANYARFVRDYSECIDRDFRHYYAIASQFSKISARYFETFCRRIGAPVRPADPVAKGLFHPHTIEEVFEIEECAFNAVKLKQRMGRDLRAAGVEVRLDTTAVRVEREENGLLAVACHGPEGSWTARAHQVFNCAYSGLNRLLQNSGLPALALKQELTELALVEVPEPLRRIGVTVMCGPFFSCMPFPARGLHSLSHVRYTPHTSWQEGPAAPPGPDCPALAVPRRSNFLSMVRDGARYLPLLARCRYHQSLWEVKTVLCSSETSDSRPILFQRHSGLPNLHCILGSKLDNIYDVLVEIDGHFAQPRAA